MQISKFSLSALFVVSFTAVAQAAPIPKDADAVGLEMKLEVDGKTVSEPYALLLMGETGTITQKIDEHSRYVIDVTPAMDDDGHVAMSFKIDKETDGKKTLLSSPNVSTANNETALIEQKDGSGPAIKLTVTPTL